MAEQYDRIDQWVDWGDHTVTIDPIGNAHWVYDGHGDTRHLSSLERRRQYDAADTKHLLDLLDKHVDPEINFHQPTSRDLDKLVKFPSCMENRLCLKESIRGTGTLPVIAQLERDGTLPDMPKGVIEKQMYGSKWGTASRVFSRGGVPDHGLPNSDNVNV
jgi:hypothetical protein